VWQCVAACCHVCSVVQCDALRVAVSQSVVQCVTVRCSDLHCISGCYSGLQCVAEWCSGQYCVAVRYGGLQRVAE